MNPAPHDLFDPFGRRNYDADAVKRFPWPVVAGYHDVHRWIDAGLGDDADAIRKALES
jgi:hypothetical protein